MGTLVRKRGRQDISCEKVIRLKETCDVEKTTKPEATEFSFEDDEGINAMQQCLVSSITGHRDGCYTNHRSRLPLVFIAILAAIVALKISCRTLPSTMPRDHVQFSCPKQVNKSANDIPTENVEYERVTNQITANVTEYMQTFRNSTFDSWGRTYEQVKKGMYHWKTAKFAPHVENGDSIYESACGIGMNLFMTLEILHEVKGIDSLAVYGNEYVAVSSEVANAVLGQHGHVKKCTICPGDSANLYFVPSNSFDLVYTGYVTPINDPLGVNMGSVNDNLKYYKRLCVEKDAYSRNQSEAAQRVQEDFYGKWVAELVRIAKPGKPVIVEQVSMPFCIENFDYGGVAREWWKPAIARYRWDVDPLSIEMEKDTIFRNRYHVFMRKNPKS